MRILHVLNDVTDKGNGIVHAAIDLASGQIHLGHTVAIASAGGGHETLLRRIGLQHLYLDLTRKPLTLLKALLTLRRHVREFRPDVVHAHTRTGLLLACVLSKVMRFPLVAHLHNVHEDESRLMGMADRVIAVSTSVGHTLAKRGMDRKKIRVVLNGTLGSPRLPAVGDLPEVELLHPAIITVCGMNHRKGLADLIAAFDLIAPQLPEAHLYLVGNGPNVEDFRRQAAAAASSKRIHFEGFQALPQAYMLAADVFVLASRRDSFGLVLTEAREAGCAIVASDVDGIPEAIDAGRAGILFPPKDIGKLAECLVRLIKDPAERALWQQRAQVGLERFHISSFAKSVDEVYDELLVSRGKDALTSQAVERAQV